MTNYKLSPEQILERMPFAPTRGQEEAIQLFCEYINNPNNHTIFLLKGYAGTGKTALIEAIYLAVEELGFQIELLATTGRAAKVLSNATNRKASTIHRRIYRATAALVEEGGAFRLNKGAKATLFVVDEASMISTSSGEYTPFGSGNLLDDLLEFVYNEEGNKLIFIGDEAQLPPVGQSESEALSSTYLHTRYGLQTYETNLDEVVRQQNDSGILSLATQLRETLEAYKHYEAGQEIPLHLDLSPYKDVRALEYDELIDSLDSAYRRYGRDNVLMISPSNKRTLEHNQGIRGRVLEYEDKLVRGEQLIVARNNYYYAQRRDKGDFIANGEIVELLHIYKYHDIYGLQFADASIYLPERDDELDVRLLISGLEDEKGQRSYEERLELYNALAYDYQIGSGSGIVDTRRAIRRDPYWGALEVKYGYAVTAHKAQGGQWPCIFIDLGLIGFLPLDIAMIRWLYTAVTRGTEQVYFINTPQALLGNTQ